MNSLRIKRVPTVVSNYQKEESDDGARQVGGCGRNCLKQCCVQGARLPLYAFKRVKEAVNEKASSFDENKEQPMPFLDSLVLGEWEDRVQKGLFRYDVTACETKVIPGEYGFIAQLNEGRHLKKRPTEFRVDKVLQPFDGRIASDNQPITLISVAVMATSLPWHPFLSSKPQTLRRFAAPIRRRPPMTVQAFQRSDFDGFAKRMASGEAWREAWRSANDGFELLVFEAKKTAERIDRQYAVSRRFSEAVSSAGDWAREVDREFEIGRRCRTLSLDFSRHLPRYRKQLNYFLDTPLGKSFATIFFLWFALSGWLFRFLILATWVLPFAGPLLIGTFANNFVIQGNCPACRRQFVGYKSQIVRCAGCGNIVWQPKRDFSSGSQGTPPSSSQSEIIDVDFEEK